VRERRGGERKRRNSSPSISLRDFLAVGRVGCVRYARSRIPLLAPPFLIHGELWKNQKNSMLIATLSLRVVRCRKYEAIRYSERGGRALSVYKFPTQRRFHRTFRVENYSIDLFCGASVCVRALSVSVTST